MREMALALFPQLTWRHHGIGVLQGYVVENVAPEVRLHVWAPELLKPGMDVSGDVHDHRFDMISHVLVGAVGHEEICEQPDEFGDWKMYALTHARAAEDTAYHGPTTPLAGHFTVSRESLVIPAGYTYRFPRGKFHRSPLSGGVTVTCVEKHNQSDSPARVLHPVAVPPVMAFGHEVNLELVGRVLIRAQEALVGCRS
jgi:hypothetical protein